MEENAEMVPVIQLGDLAALRAAQEHLGTHGYKTKVGPFSELSEAEYQDWMIPERDGYLFYLEKASYQSAMEILGEFFGYTGDRTDSEHNTRPGAN